MLTNLIYQAGKKCKETIYSLAENMFYSQNIAYAEIRNNMAVYTKEDSGLVDYPLGLTPQLAATTLRI